MKKGFSFVKGGGKESDPQHHSATENQQSSRSNQKVILQFAGLAFQFLAGIGITVFIGFKLDQWLEWKLPIWVWVLPLLLIVSMIYGIIKKVKS